MASVGKRDDKWIVRYKHGGKHRQKTFRLKKEADKFRLTAESEMEQGTHVAAGESATVKKVCEEFLRFQDQRLHEKRLGRSRHVEMVRVCERDIVPTLGHRLFSKLEWAEVEDFRRRLSERGLAPMSLKAIMDMFKQIEDFARKRGYTRRQIIADVKREHRGAKAHRIRIPTPDEVMTLLKTADQRALWQEPRTVSLLRLAVHLAAFCGLRYGEIMGLRVPNLNFVDGVIEVRHSLTRWDELKGPKTRAGVRDVNMPTHLSKLLQDWLRQFYLENDRQIVIRRKTGRCLTNASFQENVWRPLLRRAGLEGEPGIGAKEWLHFHSLRHFAASWMIANNLPLTDVAHMMGHEKFDMTLQVYAHPIIAIDRRMEAVENMATKLLPAP